MRLLLLMSCLTSVGAQDRAEAVLSKAIVVEEGERDLRRAAALYRSVIGSSGPEEVRSRAHLRLAKLLRGLGENDEALTHLQAAAEGQGGAADEAKRLLDPAQDPNVEGNVVQAIGRLRKGEGTAVQDLVWLGAASVPLLMRVVDAESVDLKFVTEGARVLMAIGGPTVEAWLERVRTDYDVLKRRAVVRSAAASSHGGRDRVLEFADDPEAAVRLELVRALKQFTPAEVVLRLLEDPDEKVRDAAWDRVARGHVNELPGDRLPHLERLFRLAMAKKEQLNHDPPSAVVKLLRYSDLSSEAGRDLYLRGLELIAGHGEAFGPRTPNPPDLGRNAHLERVMEIARKLAKNRPWPRESRQLGVFATACIPHWDHSAVDAVLELVELGYVWRGLADWFGANVSDAEWARVIEMLDRFRDRDKVLEALAKRDEAAARNWRPLRDWLVASISQPSREEWPSVMHAVRILAAVELPETAEWLLPWLTTDLWGSPAVIAKGNANLLFGAAMYVLMNQRSDAVSDRVLRGLLVARFPSGADDRKWRMQACTALASRGDRRAIELYPEAYRLGLDELSTVIRGTQTTARGLRWILEKSARYTEDQLAAIVRGCLATGDADAWRDIWYALSHSKPLAVVQAVCDEAAHAPDSELQNLLERGRLTRAGSVSYQSMLLRVVEQRAPQLRALAVEQLRRFAASDDVYGLLLELTSDREIVVARAAVSSLSGRGDAAKTDIAEFLESDRPSMRSTAIKTLAELGGNELDEAIAARITDPDWSVRRAAIAYAQSRLTPDFVPALIRALRDRDERVRQSAKEVLNQIEFVDAQKQRWDQALNGTAMTADGAAIALVEKTGPENQKAVRIAAIQSLGTLGKPETLPALIELMVDEDPEIAAAAKAAVDKINAAPAKQKKL